MPNIHLSNENPRDIPITISCGWKNYELIDSGNGMKLERYGNVWLVRPEAEAFWQKNLPEIEWEKANAVYFSPSQDENGSWKVTKPFQNPWNIQVDKVSCKLEINNSRHIGLFPEQYPQWQWLSERINSSHSPMKILNLFGYTGIATLFAARAGAFVTHVDASRKAVAWAKENQMLSGLQEKPIRWIVDDALKFVKREGRRQNYYDAIVLDPPKFGRGPNGEIWDFYKYIPLLLQACEAILSEQASFFLLTAYAIKASALTLQRVLQQRLQNHGGKVTAGELVQQETCNQKYLSRAIYALWEK